MGRRDQIEAAPLFHPHAVRAVEGEREGVWRSFLVHTEPMPSWRFVASGKSRKRSGYICHTDILAGSPGK